MNLFLAACRARGPLQLGVSYAGEPESLRRSFRQPFVTIGSDPTADLVLESDQVSDRHAYLQLVGGRVFCIDLGSAAGIQWGEVTGRWGWVQPRQGIRVGGCHIHILEGNPAGATGFAENPLSASESASDALPAVRLELLRGPDAQKTWRMNRALALVGKAPECKVHVVGAQVAPFHCSLVRTPHGVWVVDLLGKESTFVNDQAVRWAWLDEGDVLRVGGVVIRFRYETAPLATLETVGALEADSERRFCQGDAAGSTLGQFQQAMPEGSLTVANPSLDLSPGLALAKASVGDPMVLALVEQFSAMQQQMFSQFQQSMVMMFQMFHTAQKEQMGQVREELDRLHAITRELSALQSELLRRQVPAATHGNTPGSAGKAGQNGGIAPPTTAAAAEPKKGGPGNHTPAAAPGENRPRPSAGTGQDIHGWLTKRIAGLEQERQSCWRRIVNFLRGK
jgi:pSer/pThr/pTyr-binding forkhead associated (FHA) protein